MKPAVSPELRQRVLNLRHRHTLRETAALTGLPLGTVKTICSRSDAFRDNAAHRALFTLPPLCRSELARPTVLDLPRPVSVTDDPEVNAVLWLHSVIDTGNAEFIDKALTAAKRIATPLKVLEQRYARHLRVANPGNELAGLFGTLDFARLEESARKASEREHLRIEAKARFGDALFFDMEAESFCISALAALERGGSSSEFDKEEAAACFRAYPDLVPNTLEDCLRELDYWEHLYRLRHAVDHHYGEAGPEGRARERFVFGLLAHRRPRNRSEAVAVFRYLAQAECMGRPESTAILENLIGASHG